MPVSHDPKACKIAILAGGKSNERPVSLNSGKGAKAALEQAGYKVEQFDPANKDDLLALIQGDFDAAFLCLHGKGGEDGSIQGFLETIRLPYTGCDIWSSATAINKARSKHYYELNGIPTPRSILINRGDSFNVEEIIAKLGDKVVVKAATEGSSIGVYIVEGKDAIGKAIDEALKLDKYVLVEQYISGSEYTVAVIDRDGEAVALPIIEIIPQAESYDYDSKYQPGGSEHICPARLDEVATSQMQDLAVRAHRALGCSGVSRNDFIIDSDGNMWILETNTIPGMTPTSLLPDASKAAGMTFSQVCELLIENALNRASESV